jgi:hypothetical protein
VRVIFIRGGLDFGIVDRRAAVGQGQLPEIRPLLVDLARRVVDGFGAQRDQRPGGVAADADFLDRQRVPDGGGLTSEAIVLVAVRLAVGRDGPDDAAFGVVEGLGAVQLAAPIGDAGFVAVQGDLDTRAADGLRGAAQRVVDRLGAEDRIAGAFEVRIGLQTPRPSES